VSRVLRLTQHMKGHFGDESNFLSLCQGKYWQKCNA